MKQEEILAVVQKSDHSVGFYRIADGAELSRIPTERYPHEFAVSPDGGSFYISEYGVQSSASKEPGGNEVAVMDVTSRRILGRISCRDFRRPHGIVCDRAGVLYVLCEASDRLLIARDPRKNGEFEEAHPTGGEKGHMLAVKRDGSRAFFMNINSHTVTTIDLRAGADVSPKTVCEGKWPEGFCFSRDESLLYVANRGGGDILVIDTARLEQVGVIRSRPVPLRMTTDRRGRIVCVHFGEDKTVSVINPENGGEEFSFALPATAVFAGLDGSARRAVFSLQNDTVKIYDTKSWVCETTFDTRAEPDVAAFVRV